MSDDVKREKPEIETKREWAHGDGGFGKSCPKSSEPVFTEPGKIPNECNGRLWGMGGVSDPCGNGAWDSKGTIVRDKNTGKVLTRDGKPIVDKVAGDGRDGRDKLGMYVVATDHLTPEQIEAFRRWWNDEDRGRYTRWFEHWLDEVCEALWIEPKGPRVINIE